ncbi:MAG: host specificity protein [Planctomycetales bacterium]|nr:host specificity protein [Planctomycetales bacterium]
MVQHSILQRLRQGQFVRLMSVGSFPSPKLVEMIGLLGDVHGIWIDQEHAFVSHAEMELMLMACRASGIDAFARVPPTDYATVMRPMETGCSGVMVAQIRTVDEVKRAVDWIRYPPRGVRGLFLSNAECGYGSLSAGQQFAAAAERRWLAIQIETAEAVACVDEIAAVDGVDLLFVGPADLSSNLGVPGEVLHERCITALKRVSAACAAAGKPWGTLSRTAEHAQTCRDLGCRLISFASDVDLIRRGMDASRQIFESLWSE